MSYSNINKLLENPKDVCTKLHCENMQWPRQTLGYGDNHTYVTMDNQQPNTVKVYKDLSTQIYGMQDANHL